MSELEDEFIHISKGELARHSIVGTMTDCAPNANSKREIIDRTEVANGVDSKKRTGSCASCNLF
jgi:hypothetical protein